MCPRRADIVLTIVIRSEIVAQDDSARFAYLPAVLVAKPERVAARRLEIKAASVIRIGERRL